MRPSPRTPVWHENIRTLAAAGPVLNDVRTSGRRPPFEESLETESLPIDGREPLRAEIEALVHSVRGEGRAHVCGVEGMRALRLAERILADIGDQQGSGGS